MEQTNNNLLALIRLMAMATDSVTQKMAAWVILNNEETKFNDWLDTISGEDVPGLLLDVIGARLEDIEAAEAEAKAGATI